MAMTAAQLMVQVTANTRNAEQGLDRVAKKTDQTGQAAKRSGGLFGSLGSKMKAGLAGGVAATVAGLGKSINLAKDFDLTMRQVGVQTGQTGNDLKALSALAMQMGKDTAFSAQDASNAMLELAKGGLTAADIKAGALKSTMTLAAAGSLEMGAAAQYVSQAMNTFGLSAAKADQVATALAGGANASTASVESLGMALSQVGPGARNAGMSLQETVAALAAFDNQGIKGSDAGTSLKTMLTRLVPQTKQAADAMTQYGLSFTKPNGEFKSMAEVAGELQKGLGGLSEVQRTQALQAIFGADAARAATAMMNEGEAGIRKYIAASKDQTTVTKMANTAMGGAAGAWEELTGSLETLGIQIGTALLPAFTAAAKGGANLIDTVSGWGDELKAALGWVQDFVRGFLAPFLPILTPLAGLFRGAAGGASALGAALAPVGNLIARNGEAFGKVAAVIFSLFIPALVKAGVAAVVAQVKIVAAFIAKGVAAARSAVMVGVAMMKMVGYFVYVAAQAAVTAAQMAAAWVAQSARAAAASTAAGARIAAAWVASGARAVASSVAAATAVAAAWVAQAARATAAVVATAAVMVAKWVLMGTQAMLQAARMAAAWLIALGPIGWVIAAVAAVAAVVYLNWDKIVKWTKAAWGAVKNGIAVTWNAIRGTVMRGLNFVKNLFLNFTGPGLLIKHWDRIKSATSNAFNAVRNFVARGMSAARNAIASAGAAARNAMQRAWDAIVNAVSNGVNRVAALAQSIKGRVLGALAGAAGWLVSAGSAIMDGLLSGIRSGIDKVKGLLNSVTNMIPNWKGPEKKDKKLLVNAGRKIMQGLVKGLTDGIPAVRKTLTELTKHIKKAMEGKQEAAWLKRIKGVNNQLVSMYKRREQLAKKHADAMAKIDDLQQQKDQFRSSVVSGISDQANVLNAGADASTIRQSLTAQLAKAKEFAANLTKLTQMGYAKPVVMQVASAGIEQGSEVAKALLAASVDDMRGINSAFTGIQSVANQAGSKIAGDMYDSGISAAKAVAKGLESQMAAIDKAVAKIAQRLKAALQKALGLGKGKGKKGKAAASLGAILSGGFAATVNPAPAGGLSGGSTVNRTVNFSFTTHNPIAEPESQTVNKALQRTVSLGLV